MKCDELVSYGMDDPAIGEEYEMYKVADVDAAIAELKARIADLEKLNHDLCERVTENDDIRLHWEEIEQTRVENERLKAKLEDVQASMYADVVDANMENRRLRRALYKACANWADVVAFEETEGIGHDNSVAEMWRKMERKCLNKMEEYK